MTLQTFGTPFLIAVSARLTSAAAVFGLVFLAGCSVLPAPPERALVYDFGPGLPVVPASPTAVAAMPALAQAAATAMPTARLPTLALADVQSAGRSDNSTAVLYRLAYTDARQLRPYQQARWAMPPAQLVQQALRTQLGERRAVLSADDALSAAREGAGLSMLAGAGSLPTVLRVELEEFSQVFSSASASTGLVRLRATLVEPTAEGEKLLGQRLFTVQAPAPSADAAGGTRALADATAQAAQAVAQWVEQLGH